MKCEPLQPGEIQASLKLVKCTIAECQGTLPGGLVSDGIPVTFEPAPATMGLKKKMGAVRNAPALQGRWGRQVPELAAAGLRALGNERGEKAGALVAELARMTVGDVLYLLLNARLIAAGGRLGLADAVCQACGAELAGIGVEIGDIELYRWPRSGEDGGPVTANNPPMVRIGLFDGIEVAPGRIARTVLARVPAWADSLWSLTSGQADNPVEVSIGIVRGALCGCELEDVPLSNGIRLKQEQVESVSDRDASLIEGAINQISPSPIFEAEIDCPECGAPHVARFNWRDPSFFGSSPRR